MREIKLPKMDCMLTDSVGTASVPKSATRVSLGVQESIIHMHERSALQPPKELTYGGIYIIR